ncbi:MAG: hypothetical protein AAFQ98_07780 [Bacteroidota bacterium]
MKINTDFLNQEGSFLSPEEKLEAFLRSFEKLKYTRPSRIRSSVIYWVIRVLAWLFIILSAAMFGLASLAEEEMEVVYQEEIVTEYASFLIRNEEGNIRSLKPDNKNVFIEEFTETMIRIVWSFEGLIINLQFLTVLWALIWIFIARLCRNLLKRSYYILRMEWLVFKYLEDTDDAKPANN